MRQRTELRQRQKQEFNARFSVAVHILQMPAAELAEQIRDALDSNPLLEEFDSHESQPADTFDHLPASSAPATDSSALLDYVAHTEHSESVRDYLLGQLGMIALSTSRRTVARVIVESIDERGFLGESLEEIRCILLDLRLDVPVDEIEQVLKTVQQLGPPGVGARNLVESLLLQLEVADASGAVINCARRVVLECFTLFTEYRFGEIGAQLGVEDDLVDTAVSLIRSLTPYPGYQFGRAAQIVVPDLIARKVKGQWQVRLNPEALPEVRIANDYRTMMSGPGSEEGQAYLKKNLASANVFLDNVNRRHETVLRVVRQIIEHQHAFLDVGESGMRPLQIKEIAQALNLHESTVSRACARKYIMTPRGTYELKRFFSVRIPNRNGSDESAEAIKHKLIQIVEHEEVAAPLSDQQISERLRSNGSQISRRTVAKYRAQLRIPARNLRKIIPSKQVKQEVV